MADIIMSISYFIDTTFTGYFLVSQNERLLIPKETTVPAKRQRYFEKIGGES